MQLTVLDMSHHPAFEHHDHPAKHGPTKTCRVCKSTYTEDQHPSHFRICKKCGFKILIVLFVVMISVSYIAWFGVI
jgi:hypothetical protein